MDAAGLRAEIKSWERAFKSEHQRNPTVDDIRALPKIVEGTAAKYKLYKKLSKEVFSLAAQRETNVAPPSTPRRSSALPGPSSLLPKSQAVAHPTPDATLNPFSPSKLSRKKIFNPNDPPFPKPNVLKCPSTPPERKWMSSMSSPDPSSPIEAEPEPASLFVNSAVKRARKRLRGDLVSPSPKKPRTVRLSSEREEDSDDEPDALYVNESPIKDASSTGKHFELLFEEERLPQPDFFMKKGPFSRTKSVAESFGSQADAQPSGSKDTNHQTKLRLLHGQNGKVSGSKERHSVRAVKSAPYASMKSNLLDNFPDISPAVTNDNPASPLTGSKRSSSVDADNLMEGSHSFFMTSGLLPPSPPASAGQPVPHNVAAQDPNRNRKKAKLVVSNAPEEDITNDDQDLQVIELDSLSIRNWSRRAAYSNDGDDDEGREPFGAIGKGSLDTVPDIEEDNSDTIESEVSLPENLRSILHVSSSHRGAREEQAVVESLLKGRRGLQDQRGEVWGIGEAEDATTTTTDDEWAGEGVPWEVAEL